MCVDMCVHVRLGAGVGVYVCYIGASFPDHRPRVKRPRGQGVMGVMGGLPTRTLTDPSHHGRPPTGELRRQGPTGPSSALSPVPLALGPPIPLRQLANWPAASRQPNSPPNSPPTPSPRPRPIAPRARATASVPTSRVPSPAVRRVQRALANLDSTRLDSTRTRLNPCPCDTLPPPP